MRRNTCYTVPGKIRRAIGVWERKTEMKRLLPAMLALLLAVSLFGCAAPAAPAKSEPAQAKSEPAQANAAPASAAPETPALAWHYEITTQTTTGEAKGDGDVLLATTSHELPQLIAVCDGDAAGQQPPSDMQKVLDAFNEGIAHYSQTALCAAEDMAATAQEQYNETDAAYRQYFNGYYEDTEVVGTRVAGDLAEVCVLECSYWGGAHGAESFRNFHFDLGTGTFFELADLTDISDKLNAEIAETVIEEIYDNGEEDWYFDDFAESIRSCEAYNVSFEEDGAHVIFSEYEIAPYAAGLPEFVIPYEKLSRFLNGRGQRLLALSEETRILGDYYDASEMWYWFEGSAPLDYDDVRGEAYAAYGGGEMPYYRVNEPGVGTMAELRAKLATRFTDELIAQRLDAEEPIPFFRELDGRLYAVAAGRGTDITVESVDYTVELNAAKDGGRILADIHRRDWDDASGDWASTGETDQVEFPFTLTDGGAVFSAFPTIW